MPVHVGTICAFESVENAFFMFYIWCCFACRHHGAGVGMEHQAHRTVSGNAAIKQFS